MAIATPESDDYEDVRFREVELDVIGGMVSVLVYEPKGSGTHPAIVIGAEGGGINRFIKRIGAALARLGFVSLVPDYYRGVTMGSDPDDYSDVTSMRAMIEALDFRRAVLDFLETIAFARQMPNVDGRVGVWGYCTGGTIAMFGASLDRDLGAAVLFYPSQLRFDALNAKRPVHVIDLAWNIACPVMIAYGDRDEVVNPEELAEIESRLQGWGIESDIKVYPEAGHAFSSPGYVGYNAGAAESAWQDGVRFIIDRMKTDAAT
ncbi:MAG TPA: dienelactone hydrolase family protein [Acidimicrobiales bacterium]|nr:dienelactone hydrolase family protein [Acidimicrobiales bacterium]